MAVGQRGTPDVRLVVGRGTLVIGVLSEAVDKLRNVSATRARCAAASFEVYL